MRPCRAQELNHAGILIPAVTLFVQGKRSAYWPPDELASRACSSLPGLKRTAFPGAMLTSVPVRGFRPMPVLRGGPQ